MRILFDHSTPAPLRRHIHGHEVSEAFELGWSRLANGDLLNAAEQAGFEMLITADKNMRYQQNLTIRKIALVIMGNAQWPILRLHLSRVLEAVDAATPGSYMEVEIPFK